MEITTSASRTSQMRSTRTERGEKEDRGKIHSTHRSTRYKEKYQSMRERFDRVNATKETNLRELELANAKIRKIQEENDILLDAMLANPPPPLNLSHPTTNPKSHQSSLPPHTVAPSQNYVQADRTSYQSTLGQPPPASMYQYNPRSEHPDHGPPPPPLQHGYNYPPPPPQPSRPYQYPQYTPSDARDSSGQHFSTNTGGRSRALPPNAAHRG